MLALCYGKAAGLFEGVEDGVFDPEGVMTRAMFAAVLQRFAGEASVNGTALSDVPAGAWYCDAALWAVENGLMAAENGAFDPGKAVTFEEAALIFERYTGSKPALEKRGVMNRAQAAELFWAMSRQVGR